MILAKHIWALLCLFGILAGLGLSACSSDGVGCNNDTDCPGTQRCFDGVCRYEVNDPCRDVECPSGQICRNGDCYPMDLDQDEDGYPVVVDCDDGNPEINPGAPERCNGVDDDCDLEIDEQILCGQTCQETQQNPATSPPSDCDAGTPCEQCYAYENSFYYCLEYNGAAHAFRAHPQTTPCDTEHHCDTLRCDEQAWHCDGQNQAWIPGDVPTGDAEACNNIDDDCDGTVDGPAAAADCPTTSHGVPRCDAGTCSFECEAGYHVCGVRCVDSSSPDSCGDRCEACQAPANGDPTCENGVCGFVCHEGHRPLGESCTPCNDSNYCGIDCQPCPGALDCCDGMCTDTSSDPLHCGDCDTSCPSASDICCPNTICCDSAQPLCCGLYCCSSASQCCPGDICCALDGSCCNDHCCNPPNSICCNEGCCPDAHPLCWGQFCCDQDAILCPGETGCCSQDWPVCCGDGACCPAETVCCSNIEGCCPSTHPVCCNGNPDFCCPAGMVCCGDSCC